MKEEKVELTEEELEQWTDEYWSKRLYWTWLNWTEFMPFMMWDSSGISTNHPYGGYISSSTNTPNEGGDICSYQNNTSNGVWFKQLTNEPRSQGRNGVNIMKKLVNILKLIISRRYLYEQVNYQSHLYNSSANNPYDFAS